MKSSQIPEKNKNKINKKKKKDWCDFGLGVAQIRTGGPIMDWVWFNWVLSNKNKNWGRY